VEYRKFGKVLGLSLLGCALSWNLNSQAQSGKLANWLTDGGDIECAAWQKDEQLLSINSVKNMKLIRSADAATRMGIARFDLTDHSHNHQRRGLRHIQR